MKLKLRVINSLAFLTVATFAAPSIAEQVCAQTDKGQTVCGERVNVNNSPRRSGSITLFTYGGSAGHQFPFSNDKPDLSQLELNDKISSIRVQFGIWQVCTDVSYKGYCVRLRPGYYGNLGRLRINNSVSSIRLIR